MKKLMLIVNPVAGKGYLSPDVGTVCSDFYLASYLPTLFFTEAPGDATRLVRTYGADFDIVVCVGGDGTLSEVMSGLVTLRPQPLLGYIPMGTTNDLAQSLQIPCNPIEAAREIIEGKPFPLDVGAFGEDAYFSYIAAFGAFTDVSYATPQQNKQVFGHLAYLLEGMMRLPAISHHKTKIEYDDGVIEDDLVFGGVTNTISIGGIVKLDESEVALSDGLFEILLVKNPQTIVDLNKILGGLLLRNYSNPFVTVLHSKKVRFTFDEPVPWTRDGEHGGEFSDITLENIQGGATIVLC